MAKGNYPVTLRGAPGPPTLGAALGALAGGTATYYPQAWFQYDVQYLKLDFIGGICRAAPPLRGCSRLS